MSLKLASIVTSDCTIIWYFMSDHYSLFTLQKILSFNTNKYTPPDSQTNIYLLFVIDMQYLCTKH